MFASQTYVIPVVLGRHSSDHGRFVNLLRLEIVFVESAELHKTELHCCSVWIFYARFCSDNFYFMFVSVPDIPI